MGTNMLPINQIENTFFNLTAQSGEKKHRQKPSK
jgi:hypothetical protein